MSVNMSKKMLEVEVEGLFCTECAVSVENPLTHWAGVDQAKICVAPRKVQLNYDESKTSKMRWLIRLRRSATFKCAVLGRLASRSTSTP